MAKTRKHGVWTCTYITPNGTYKVISQRKPRKKKGESNGNNIVTGRDLLDERTRRIIDTKFIESEGYYNKYLYFMSQEQLVKAKKHLERHLKHIGTTDRWVENMDSYNHTLSYIEELLVDIQKHGDHSLHEYYTKLAKRLNGMGFEKFGDDGFWHFEEPQMEHVENGVVITYTDDFDYSTSLVRAYVDFGNKSIEAKIERKRKNEA